MLKQYSIYLTLAVSACLLMLAAFYNGFPLVYSDTSTYIASGFELETPADRPITYGLFLRLTSLNGLSLWGTVFFQSLMLAWLLYKLIDKLTISIKGPKIILVVALCVVSTGVSWTASQLIADVFTPMLIILWALILIDKSASKKTLWCYYFLLFFITAMHMSHFVMTLGLLLVLVLFRINKKFRSEIPLAKMGFILLSVALAFPVFGSSFSKYSNVFFVGKLDGSGLLKEILDDNCATYNFRLCQYKDSLPHDNNYFIWDENSPLQKLGGYTGEADELKEIKKLSLSRGKYIKKIIKTSIEDSRQQLFAFDIADGNGIFMDGTKLYERIKLYTKNDAAMYANSCQQKGNLVKEGDFMFYFNIIMLLAATLSFGLLFIKKFSFEFYMLSITIICGVLFNAIVCGTFSAVANRYQCRVAWLMVILVVVLFAAKGNIKKMANK